VDKKTVIAQVEEEYGNLLSALEGLDDAALGEKFYGDWSICDILAHITGWQVLGTEWMERMARGERPTPEGADYSDSDAWNARFAASMKGQSPSTVVAGLKQSHANYLRAARAIPEDRFGEGKTINRLLESNGWGHYREHLPAIKQFRSGRAAA
jgi:hypothetical protein